MVVRSSAGVTRTTRGHGVAGVRPGGHDVVTAGGAEQTDAAGVLEARGEGAVDDGRALDVGHGGVGAAGQLAGLELDVGHRGERRGGGAGGERQCERRDGGGEECGLLHGDSWRRGRWVSGAARVPVPTLEVPVPASSTVETPGPPFGCHRLVTGSSRICGTTNWFATGTGSPVPFVHDFPDVDAVRADPARGPRGRRGPEPPPARPRRLHPPRRARHLHLAAAGPARAAPRGADHPRRDGRDRRPGAVVPRAAAARALRGQRPLDRVRRRHLPAQGPQGRRLPARADPRGDVHPRGQGPVLVVQGPAAVDLPDPDQVPRRGATPRRAAARPRVRDEGLLLLRRRRRGPRAQLPGPPRRLHPHLRPARLRVRHRQGRGRRDGRVEVRGVPRQGRGRRGHLRPLLEVRLRRQRRGRRHARAGPHVVRRRTGRARRADPRHPDHRHAGRATSTTPSRAPTAPGPPATP